MMSNSTSNTKLSLSNSQPELDDDFLERNTDALKIAKSTPVRRTGILLLLGLLTALGGLFVLASRAWHLTALREAYLPELVALAKHEKLDGSVQSILALRQAQSADYEASAQSLRKAIEAGENTDTIWLTWAASLAASGDRRSSAETLLLGKKTPSLQPAMEGAIQRVSKLKSNASSGDIASAICPEGPGKKLSAYSQGSFLNGLAQTWGRRNPEKSGYATREAWILQEPNNPAVQRLWGEALLRNSRLSEAEMALTSSIHGDANSPEAHLALGDVYRESGANAKAGVEYGAALKLRKNWFPALLGMGDIAVKKELITIAVEAYEKAYKLQPDSVEAMIGLGKAYYNQKTALDRSLDMFQKAAKAAPDRTDFFSYYSNALRNNYKMDEAETILRRRLAEVPTDARCHYLLGLLLLDNKPSSSRETEAERELRTALDNEPASISTKVRLARLLIARGAPREATPLLEQAVQQDRYNVPALVALQLAYEKTGRTAEAKRTQDIAQDTDRYVQKTSFLEDMLTRQPTDLAHHEELVKLYTNGNELEKAQMHSQMAMMIKTRPKEAEAGIRALNGSTAISSPGFDKR